MSSLVIMIISKPVRHYLCFCSSFFCGITFAC